MSARLTFLPDDGAWWLALDASTYAGSVAVLRGREVVAEREVAMRGETQERLMPAVADAMTEAGVSAAMLAAVVCGAGPGSFTSLRIAASIAKGIAHVTGAPLLAAPSLALAAASAGRTAGVRLVAADAMRAESFAALVTSGTSGDVEAYDYLGLVATDALDELAAARHAERVHAAPRAGAVVALGALLADAGAVDLDGWEPDYGRKAEAQVKWEAAHGRALPAQAGTADASAPA